MKRLNQKLTLKKETLSALDNDAMRTVKGGFLSIGHACSHRNNCDRLDEPGAHVTYHSCQP